MVLPDGPSTSEPGSSLKVVPGGPDQDSVDDPADRMKTGSALNDTWKSSSRIVPTPVASEMAVPDEGLERSMKRVSSGSIAVSPATGTTIVRFETPGSNVSVPDTAW